MSQMDRLRFAPPTFKKNTLDLVGLSFNPDDLQKCCKTRFMLLAVETVAFPLGPGHLRRINEKALDLPDMELMAAIFSVPPPH